MKTEKEIAVPLVQIEIENYKSFTNESISLKGVTAIVGANESGKSNLLNAIFHLSSGTQKNPYKPKELRIGALGYPAGKIKICYKVKITETLIGVHSKNFSGAIGATLVLTKEGKPNEVPSWQASIDLPHHSISDIIKINKKAYFKRAFAHNTTTKKKASPRCDNGWFLKDNSVDLRTKPFKELLHKGIIELLTGKQKKMFLETILKDEVLKNIKIFQWNYQERDFLPENVNIKEFIANPNNFKTVSSMFKIAGWKGNAIARNLQNQDDTVYANLFEAVEREINSLIRKNWSTHNKLEIELQHKGEYFTIHLKEPGSKTPPEYRSDGLKWYLTFLINFRAHSKDFKNYILLIDEPGLHLHPRGQKDTLKELQNLYSKYINQVIYTTHQTFLIDKNNPEGVRVIERKLDQAGLLAKTPFFASQVSNVTDSKQFILSDKLLREALGFQVSDISPINENNILVEGVFDRNVLHILNNHWGILDFNDISIIECGGAPDIIKHASLYKAHGLKVVCLYDSDTIGKSSFNRNNKVTNNEKIQISDFSSSPNYETMEDLIPDMEFSTAFQKWSKIWKISEEMPNRPRMKKIESYIKGERRLEIKHSLEDFLIDVVKKNILKDDSKFVELKKILKDLSRRFPK